MQAAHGNTWECRAPSHDPIIFELETQYQEHSIKEHGLPETHARALSNAARRPNLDKLLECPFGDDFRPTEDAGASAVFSSDALQSHLASHMKAIALLALQKLPSNEDQHAKNIGSDQCTDDAGPEGVAGAARASMCSVLDDEDADFEETDALDAFSADSQELSRLIENVERFASTLNEFRDQIPLDPQSTFLEITGTIGELFSLGSILRQLETTEESHDQDNIDSIASGVRLVSRSIQRTLSVAHDIISTADATPTTAYENLDHRMTVVEGSSLLGRLKLYHAFVSGLLSELRTPSFDNDMIGKKGSLQILVERQDEADANRWVQEAIESGMPSPLETKLSKPKTQVASRCID